MTRKLFGPVLRVVPLVILLCLLLTGCGCKHEWQAANCETPKTCTLCQATEGEALGHTWADATCKAPKTCTGCGKTEGETLPHTWVDVSCAAPKHCSACNVTEGEALAHTWVDATCAAPKTCSVCNATEGETLAHTWVDATCTTPKTCSVCKVTEGNASGHSWRDANCIYAKYCPVCYAEEGSALGHQWVEATTEAPKTCSRCNTTEGTKIISDPRFKSAACKDLFGTWKCTIKIPGKDLVDEGFTQDLTVTYTVTFKNDGLLSFLIQGDSIGNYAQAVETYLIDALYKEFAAQGYDQAQADAAMKSYYGKDVKSYSRAYAYQLKEMFNNYTDRGVYYVNSGYLYIGPSWPEADQKSIYNLNGGTLTMKNIFEGLPDLALTKA